jgi:DNA-binding GntR family transcriptional regulator
VDAACPLEVAQTVTPALLRSLRRYHTDEHRARHGGDRIEATRLVGEFHLVLARHGTNKLFADIVEETVDQTFLIAVLYQAPESPPCVKDEREALIAAIEKCDPVASARAMREHIDGFESRMLLVEGPAPELDIKSAFAGLG